MKPFGSTHRFQFNTAGLGRISNWVHMTRSMTSRRASCSVGIKSWSWRTQRYSMNRRVLNRTGSWMRKGPSYWITCTGPMGHRPVHPRCQINSVRLRTMWSSLLLWLSLTFSVGMIQSLGTLAQSQPLKRRSEGNVMGLLVIFFLSVLMSLLTIQGGCIQIKGRKIIYGLYYMVWVCEKR